MAKVILNKVSKTYDKTVNVIDNIDLEVQDKEFIILVGSSGCGKSTLLRLICGLESVSSGQIFINNICVNNVHPKDRDIAFVFQNYALYPHMTVFDNIAFPLKMKNYPKQLIQQKVLYACQILQLNDLLKRKPKELSGGQRQRVALGRAIVRNPKVFLMDEPLSNLDAKLRMEMRLQIKQLHKQLNTTFIYVTHDQTEALTMADRIVVLNQGRIEQIDKPKNVYNNPNNTFVAGFLGNPPMNFINIEIINKQFFILQDKKIFLQSINRLDLADKKHLTLGLRPEAFCTSQSVENSINIQPFIKFKELLGGEIILYFTINEQKCCAKLIENDLDSNNLTLFISLNNLLFFDPITGQKI